MLMCSIVTTGVLNDVLLQYHVTGKLLGDTTLFFGCRHQSQDFLYEDELTQYEKDEVLTKLFVAFSRDQVCVCCCMCGCVCVLVLHPCNILSITDIEKYFQANKHY